MKNLWDITGDRSEWLDIEECVLYFCPPPILPHAIAFELWGVVLHTTERDWPEEFRVEGIEFDARRQSVFVAGISRITIAEPERGSLLVAPYDSSGKEFVPTRNGGHLQLRREWRGAASENCYEYNIGGRLDWPDGDCNVAVYSSGRQALNSSRRAVYRSRPTSTMKKGIGHPERAL